MPSREEIQYFVEFFARLAGGFTAIGLGLWILKVYLYGLGE